MRAAMTQGEREIADQILNLLSGLAPDDAKRVLAHVQGELGDHDDGDTYYSRGIAGPLGKLTQEVKSRIDEHTHSLFIQQCAMRGTDVSHEVRNCVYALVHGKSYDQMVMEKVNHDAKRTEALVKLIGPICATEYGGATRG